MSRLIAIPHIFVALFNGQCRKCGLYTELNAVGRCQQCDRTLSGGKK